METITIDIVELFPCDCFRYRQRRFWKENWLWMFVSICLIGALIFYFIYNESHSTVIAPVATETTTAGSKTTVATKSTTTDPNGIYNFIDDSNK